MTGLRNTIKELYQNRLMVGIFLIILVLSQFALQYRSSIFPKIYLVIVVIAIIVLLSVSRLNDSSKLPRNIFVLIMCLGIVNSLSLPVRQELDENTHFFYSVQIADGQFLTRDFDQMHYLQMSPNFLEETKLASKQEGGKENTNLYSKAFLSIKNQKANYSNAGPITGIANPVYYPSALGIALGRLISPYFFVSYYLGRIFNLLMYALLAFFAVKLSKKYRLQLFVAGLIPYTIWIAAGYNYDALYYGLILLLLAQLTNFFVHDNKITTKKMLGFVVTGAALVFCKAPMALLIVIPLFLPLEYYKTQKDGLKSKCLIAGGGIIGILWVLQSKILSTFRKLIGRSVVLASSSNGTLEHRLSYFIAHPAYTLGLTMRSIFDVFSTVYGSFTGPQPFLQNQIPTGAVGFFNVILMILLLILVSYHLELQLPNRLKIVIPILIVIITGGIIYTISGDARVFRLGDLDVQGVQGRYHFYILAMLPLFLASPIQKLFRKQELKTSDNYDLWLQSFVVKLVFILTFVNTCIGIFGYL